MTDFRRKVSDIADRLELTADNLEKRLILFHLDKMESSAIGEWLEAAEKDNNCFIDEFFRRLTSTMSIFEKAATKIDRERLKRLVGVYFREMILAQRDVGHALRRIEIGVIHQELGISREQLTAAFSIIAECFLEWTDRAADRPGMPKRPLSVGDLTYLFKAIVFDLSIVLETIAGADLRMIELSAGRDGLTRLPNHNKLVETLNKRLPYCTNENPLAVLFVGLNHFKAVNETLGHAVGDRILIEAAERLKEACPDNGMVSRLGGDIFVVLAPLTSEDDLEEAVQSVLDALDRPLKMDGFSVDVTASVGVAVASSGDLTAADLMSRADTALFNAKHRQLTKTVYAFDMKRYSIGQLSISAELRRAIDCNELVLFYQPKIELKTGEVVGVEALIRWIHPIRGFVPPSLFIPIAEQSVLIHPITDWVLNAAVAQAADWQHRGIHLAVSVNLSAPNLQNSELPLLLKKLLADFHVPAEQIILEITESGLMADPGRALDTINRLRAVGVGLSIDDFGTGYSSLAYLKNLPVDEVKIDQVFVLGMASDEKDERIVRSAVQLAHGLGLDVSAEGVEDATTLRKLRALGCNTAQGFHISKPLPSYELEKFLLERRAAKKKKRSSFNLEPSPL